MLRELRGIGFKALRPRSLQDALADVKYFGAIEIDDASPSLLLDAHNPLLYGGTGERASTEIALAVKAKTPRLMLAGGLNPDNVGEAVKAIRPWAVDVASGVEGDHPGRKDAAKIKAFIKAVKAAESDSTGENG
jgi:phosphoribosylanthranilate isomerase